MANPTSNFGWQMPTNTDLVTDLPADFEVFGQAVDTSLMDLKGGTTGQVLSKASNTDMDFTWVAQDDSNAIQNAIVDAKGDLIAASAADTPARLAVGTNGQVLTADSAETTGLKWTTISAGGMTELASGSLSSAALSLSSISGSYKSLILVLTNYSFGASTDLQLRLNSDSGSNYTFGGVKSGGSVALFGGNASAFYLRADTAMKASTSGFSTVIQFPNYSYSSSMKIANWTSVYTDSSNNVTSAMGGGNWNNTSSAINAISTVNSFSSADYKLYGVS